MKTRTPAADPKEITRFLQQKLPEALDFLKQMVEVNSYTLNREGVRRVSEITAAAFAPLGFGAERIKSANPDYGDHLVLTRRGHSSRSIAMVSHLDTVFPVEEEKRNNFHWQPEGNRIYGPGTQDIKGGTAMMWLVLHALHQHAPDLLDEITWQLFWNSSEEVLSHDFGELCRERMQRTTLAALVFEAEGRFGDSCLLVTSRKGRATWRATARGRGAHAGGKHRHGANAILQLARAVEKIAALTDYSTELTFNVGTIKGGSGLNRVPHEAFAEGEMRAFSREAYESGKRALLALSGPGEVQSVADRYACDVQVEILTESQPWPRNPATDRLFQIWQNCGKELGFAVDREERGGLSDGNFLWDSVPTLDGLGPWGDNDHCSERSPDGSKVPEFVDAASFVPKAALNTMAILKLLETTPLSA